MCYLTLVRSPCCGYLRFLLYNHFRLVLTAASDCACALTRHAEDDLSVLLWKADRHVSSATSSAHYRRHGGYYSSQGIGKTHFQYISQCEIDIPLLRTLEIGIGSRNNLTLDGWLRIPGGERLHTSTASCVTKAADTVLDD